jgi:UDP-glucose 6-dehydrogenase
VAAGLLHFTTDIERASHFGTVQFIAVGTPPDEDGSADMKYVTAVARNIGKYMTDYKVVDKSTVPVGTADAVRAAITEELQKRGVTNPFSVVSNPEFLTEGAAIDDFMKADRIVVGCDDEQATHNMRALYVPFQRNHDRMNLMDIRSAELTKYAAVDGSINLKVLNAVEEANDLQKHVLGNKIKARFGTDLTGKHFALWGLAFKANTDDMRKATSLEVIKDLIAAGATVTAYDPVTGAEARHCFPDEPRLSYADNQSSALDNADALVIVTEWKEFRSPDFDALKAKLKTPIIFDGRNLYDPKAVRGLGFEYLAIGR